MELKIACILCVTFLLAIPVFCEDESDSFSDFESLFDSVEDTEEETTDDESTDSMNKIDLLHESNVSLHYPVIEDNLTFEDISMAPRLFNYFTIKAEYGDFLLVSKWLGDMVFTNTYEWDNLLTVRPEENYFSWDLDKVTLKGGLQIFSWGTADTNNPTDNINPRDYTFSGTGEKLPILSISANTFISENFSFDMIYIPCEREDKFGFDFADQIPNTLFNRRVITNVQMPQMDFLTEEFAETKDVSINHINFEPASLVVGSKANFYFPAIDFSISYIYDMDPFYTPDITLARYKAVDQAVIDAIPPGPEQAYLDSLYAYRVESVILENLRLHRFGFDFKSVIDRFSLWVETCFTLSEDIELDDTGIRNHQLSWTTGFDFNYGKDENFYFNLQHLGWWIPSYDRDILSDYPGGLPDNSQVDNESYMEEYYYRQLVYRLAGESEELLLGGSLNLKWPLYDNSFTPSFTGIYMVPVLYDNTDEERYGGMKLNFDIDFVPVDSFHIFLGFNYYYAWKKDKATDEISLDENDKFGSNHNNSNIYFMLQYTWGAEL